VDAVATAIWGSDWGKPGADAILGKNVAMLQQNDVHMRLSHANSDAACESFVAIGSIASLKTFLEKLTVHARSGE
jgi:hypothetical protein